MILELLFITYIRIFFGHCHVTFPYKEILSFVGYCHVTFPYKYVFFILGNSLCSSKICCFQIHFVTSSRKIQMAAIMLQTIPRFYAKISGKSLFISATTYEKYIVCKDHCIAHHNEKTCFLPTCKYHVVLLGNVQELPKKLDTFLLHLSTRGLSVYTFQVSIQWKNYFKEWTNVW